ncbi:MULTISPECIES: hypothetical protein [unclassified Sphingomonas]|uniref:hypothetical protein n=1 Tax=unclassified Sphingomonas TaxID=196159 RepID=UPI00226ADCE6|nr:MULTISPECIES: hypothetical protein [unclassified Sphingomonas]
MTLYKQDVLDLASLETSTAAAIKAQLVGGLIEQDAPLYQAYHTATVRAQVMTDIASTMDAKS